MTYRIVNEARFDGLLPDQVAALVNAEQAGQAPATVIVTWADLARVNDPETMEEIARLAIGEATVLGMCDSIKRLS